MNKKIVLIYGDNSHGNSEAIQITLEDLKIRDEFESNEKTNKVLNSIENSSINNSPFLSYFQYDDFSMWWFLRPSIVMPLRSIINFIDRFQEVIEEKKPTKVRVVGDFSKLIIIKQICAKKNIAFTYSKFAYFKFKQKHSIKIKFQKERFKKIFHSKFNSRLKIYKSKKNLIHSDTGSIIFAIPTGYRRPIFDHATKKTKGEFIQGNLISIIKQLNYSTSCIDLDYTFHGEPEILKERIKEGNWKPLEYFIDNKITLNHKNFFKIFKKTIQNEKFRSLFQYSEIYLWSALEENFLTLSYRPSIPWYLQVVDSFFNYFKNQKPKAVFLPYEKGPLALAIMLACERYDIRTFGVQHGLWFKVHPDYSAISFRSKDNLLGMPLPSKMLLFGEFTKQLLIKEVNYPQEKLVTLGNPAFFDLNNLIHNLRKQDLKLKYRIPTGKKVILFATGRNQQYYFKEIGKDYDERVLEHLLINLPKNENFHIIIKPHPLEPNVNAYEKLIEKHNRNDFFIIQESMYELLLLSDVSLTVHSTSLIDSITMGTPAIGVKFGDSKYYSLLENMGVAVTSTLNLLSEEVIHTLSDSKLIQKLQLRRAEFLKFVYNYPNENAKLQLQKLLNV